MIGYVDDDILLNGWHGATFRWKRYYRWSEGWSHDHCDFCFATFVDSGSDDPRPGTLNEGYAQTAHDKSPMTMIGYVLSALRSCTKRRDGQS